MKLEGKRLERHLEHAHGMIVFTGQQDAKRWHAIDHKYGAKHKHEEAQQTR